MTGHFAAVIAGGQSARSEFARRLCELHSAAGNPSLRTVAAAAQHHLATQSPEPIGVRISAQRISDWKAGRNVPARMQTLTPVLHVLFRRARRRNHENKELLSLRAWLELWRAAEQEPRLVLGTGPCPACGHSPEGRQRASVAAVAFDQAAAG